MGRKVNSALAVNATKPIFASALLPTRPLSMITKLSQTKEDNQGQTITTKDNHRHQRQPKATRIPRTAKDTRQPKTARQPYSTKDKQWQLRTTKDIKDNQLQQDNEGQPKTIKDNETTKATEQLSMITKLEQNRRIPKKRQICSMVLIPQSRITTFFELLERRSTLKSLSSF